MSDQASDIEKAPVAAFLPDGKTAYPDKKLDLRDQVAVTDYRLAEDDQDADNATPDIRLPDNGFGRFLATVGDLNRKLEKALGIEARAIQRVREDERTDPHLYHNLMVWLAANCTLPTMSIGVLGPFVFGMRLGDCLLTIAFFSLFAGFFPAFCATFGPRLGLRQMTSSRFSWGYYGAKFVALLNCMACVGWSISNTIAGAQTLSAVADFEGAFTSGAVGVVIIGVLTLVVGLFGYRVVHWYEQCAWIPAAITFIVLLGVSAKHFVSLPMNTGEAEAASVLSFGGTIWGFVIGWVSLASDYNVYMPADASRKRIFWYTYAGVVTPCILLMWLGSAIASAATSVADANGDIIPGSSAELVKWYQGYMNEELGGLVHQVLVNPMGGGGKFFMVLLVLSVVANNIVNVYSMGLSISVISHYLAALPRLIWPVIVTAIYIPLAIVGYNNFAKTLENFMSVLGYWLAIFVTVVVEEHFIFRKNNFANYHPKTTWNNKRKLPIGLGAIGALCFGAVGVAMGMSQVWFTGPIAKKFGGDIGFELASAFTGTTYPFLRYLEIKYVGR